MLRAFAEHMRSGDAHLLLAGPSVAGVSDDPEGAEVLEEVKARRDELPDEKRARVHLASLPTDDIEENAAMVNAIQRRSTVVLQKSLAEGFGLTVAEAMWKARPMVASRVGGIQDQIEDGVSGVLIDDPTDLEAVAKAVDGFISDPQRAAEVGEAAQTEGPRALPRHPQPRRLHAPAREAARLRLDSEVAALVGASPVAPARKAASSSSRASGGMSSSVTRPVAAIITRICST